MALSAALPPDMPQESRYFGITIILSVIAWTSLGRQVRGRFLALRTEDFVLAARLSGASDLRIIIRHMVPSFTSHIIASLTLSIPGIILAETALSFLGLGLRQPAISWGILLQEAQNIRTVALSPWLFAGSQKPESIFLPDGSYRSGSGWCQFQSSRWQDTGYRRRKRLWQKCHRQGNSGHGAPAG
jgi:ABC-type dipeptide/oligopeptide/nickel transport system permease subunit